MMFILTLAVIAAPALLLASVLMLLHVANRLIAVEREMGEIRATLHCLLENRNDNAIRQGLARNEAIVTAIANHVGADVPNPMLRTYLPMPITRLPLE
jgi:hypothetical protein